MAHPVALNRPPVSSTPRPQGSWVGFGLAISALYCWLGLARWARGEAQSYDLGIFTQIAKDWSAGRLPAPPLKGASAFGDHFSPITVLFGAGYRIWPDPRSLIVVQSIAVAIAVTLLARYAAQKFGRGTVGVAQGLVAALSLPLIAPVVFEVHEVALGAPIIAGLAIAVHDGRWRLAVGCSLLAVTIKEDVGLMVTAAGVAWWVARREPRRALILVAIGVLATIVAQAVIIYAHPSHTSPYLRHLVNEQAASGLLQPARLAPLLIFALLSGLAVRPVTLIALPVLAWRTLSSNPLYWQVNLHYDALIAPVALVVLINSLHDARWLQPGRTTALRDGVSIAAAVAVSVAGVGHTLSQRPWEVAPWDARSAYPGLDELTSSVPEGAPVVVDNRLGPPLIPRYEVLMLSDNKPARARWVLLDMSKDSQDAPLCAKSLWADRQVSVIRSGDLALVDLRRSTAVILPACLLTSAEHVDGSGHFRTRRVPLKNIPTGPSP